MTVANVNRRRKLGENPSQIAMDDLTRTRVIRWSHEENTEVATKILKARARNPTASLTVLLDNAQQGFPVSRRRKNLTTGTAPAVVKLMGEIAMKNLHDLGELQRMNDKQSLLIDQLNQKMSNAEGELLELDDETFLEQTQQRVFALTPVADALEFYNADEMFRVIPEDRILGGAVEIITNRILEPKEVNLSADSLSKLAKMLVSQSITTPIVPINGNGHSSPPTFSHKSPPAPVQSIVNHRSILVCGVLDHSISGIRSAIRPKNADVRFLRQADRDPQLVQSDTCMVIWMKRCVPKPQQKMINRRWNQLGRNRDQIHSITSHQQIFDLVKQQCSRRI